MRIDDQGTAMVKAETTGSIKLRKIPEITINDLKLTPQEKQQIQMEKNKIIDQSQDQVESAMDTANTLMELSGYHMKFRVDEDSERLQVTLIDNQSLEVIKEIPSTQMLELSARIKDLLDTINKMVGVFVDEIG